MQGSQSHLDQLLFKGPESPITSNGLEQLGVTLSLNHIQMI